MIMVSQDTVYGGDLDGIAKVMENMVNHIDVKTLNVSQPQAKQLVKKVNNVSRNALLGHMWRKICGGPNKVHAKSLIPMIVVCQ